MVSDGEIISATEQFTMDSKHFRIAKIPAFGIPHDPL